MTWQGEGTKALLFARPYANDPDKTWEEHYDLELGSDHWLSYTVNADGQISGAIVYHKTKTETGWCSGSIMFDVPEAESYKRPEAGHFTFWQVQSRDPLTISPSLLCHCGDHGHIQGGRWVPS